MWQIAHIGECHRGACLDAYASRREAVFPVQVANLDRVDSCRNRADWTGNRRRRGWRPQGAELPLQREHPHGIAIRAALQLVAARGDGDELFPVDLLNDGRRTGPEPGLDPPQLLAGLGVERQQVAVRLAAENQTASRHGRAATTADAVR